MPGARLIALTALSLATLPAVAHANAKIAVTTVEGTPAVVFDDDAGHAAATYFTLDRPYGDLLVQFQHNGPVDAGPGCQLEQGKTGSGVCSGFKAVLVDAGDGDDVVGLTLWRWTTPPTVESVPGVVVGGPGDDTISGNGAPAGDPGQHPMYAFAGGDGDDRLQGAAGDDYLEGGEGNDVLTAKEGADEVRGGPGDDEVSAGFRGTGDVLDGGEGVDRIPKVENSDYRRSLGADLSVTEDGQANDGEAGERDNVTSVEQLELHGRAVTFSGTAGPDEVFVNATSSTLAGLGGNDRLVGWDGSDTLEGGEGDDQLEGGFGSDVLDGGPGKDEFRGDSTERVVAASGDDNIRARDGVAEQVDCGIGADTAVVDSIDVVAATCEAVDGGPGPRPKPDPTPNPKPRPMGDVLESFALLGRPTLRRLAGRGLAFEVGCRAACEITAELTLDRRSARRVRLRGATVGRVSGRLASSGRARLVIRPARALARRLRRLRKATAALEITVTGTTGKSTTTHRRFTLR